MNDPAFGADPLPSSRTVPEAGAVRPSALQRPYVRTKVLAGPPDGMPADSIYVRRFWVAAIGPGAVADLLRLMRAGKGRDQVRSPIYLHVLVQSGLAAFNGTTVTVANTVPLLPSHLVRRLPVTLRREHGVWMRLRGRR